MKIILIIDAAVTVYENTFRVLSLVTYLYFYFSYPVPLLLSVYTFSLDTKNPFLLSGPYLCLVLVIVESNILHLGTNNDEENQKYL
jgi:hypothetical protein